MRFSVLPFMMILSLALCWNVLAQERPLAGEVSVAPTQVDVKGNGAKFNEYRDLRDGFYGRIGLRYDAEETHLDFRGDDMGHKDQKYELDGGRWGSVKYHLGDDEIPHNFTFGDSPSINRKTFVR